MRSWYPAYCNSSSISFNPELKYHNKIDIILIEVHWIIGSTNLILYYR